jgi:hypothetical protein
MLAGISLALLVETKGFGFAMAAFNCATLPWTPRRNCLLVSSANQRRRCASTEVRIWINRVVLKVADLPG